MSLMSAFGSLGEEARRFNLSLTEAVAALPPASSPSAGSSAPPCTRLPMKVFTASEVMVLEPWELALEVWLDSPGSQGYSTEEHRITERLGDIAARVPRALPGQASAQALADVNAMFASTSRGQPVFMELLRPQHGRAHFLYFWKAFCEAVHIVGVPPNEGLTAELEILRDRLLRRFEEVALADACDGSTGATRASSSGMPSSPGGTTLLPTWAIVEEVHRAGSMSAFPHFWQRASDNLAAQMTLESLSIEELTSVLLAWLHDSQLWEAEQRMRTPTQGLWRSPSAVEEDQGLEVFVHIYDVSQAEGIQKLNRILAHKKSPVKFGGVFHAGVEVNGLEWSYGCSDRESRPGICCVERKTHPQHHFRQSVQLRNTKLPPERIAEIISDLIEEYPGTDYNLLRRNCCHFADEFCIRLGVGGIPAWIHRLARLGAGIETMLQNAPRPIKERLLG